MELTEKEEKLIAEIRKLPYGQIVIYMEKGEPVRIVEVRESKKL